MSTETQDVTDIAYDIWNRKYRYQGSVDVPEDKEYKDTWRRIANAIAIKEKDSATWSEKFYNILEDFKFLPGGRIISNAGTSREEVTMFNCYVMNTIGDSLDSIFETVKESAMTQKQGGGVGFDFSSLRPEGSLIRGCEAESSGPLSFMRVFNASCQTIMSAGQRRGAQMGVMRCDHPDIEKFITAKRGNQDLRMFNLSVGITDKFIQAVKNNQEWELSFDGKVYRTVHASELWDLIMRSTYEFAEPGFLLIDRINEMNNLAYCEDIRATNPCGEQPLPPYGACLLGSINLTRFVKNPFTMNAEVDYKGIEETIKVAVRMLDNVIDLSKYPLEKQREEAYAKRRMGIGITGLANLFVFMRVRYGSQQSIELAEKVMRTITEAAYRSSVELAKEKGAFPMLDADAYVKSKFIQKLPKDLQEDIRKYGIRNSHLTSIAPTGTISLLAGNVSSGLEPTFAFSYTRKIRTGQEDETIEVDVEDYAFRKYREHLGVEKLSYSQLPEYFASTDDVNPIEHVTIQAALQGWVDSSISKTINVPKDYPFEDFKDIYMKAYELGLKGCTTFRPSDFFTGVLIKKEDKPEEKKEEKVATPAPKKPTSRPGELEGTTYKIKTPLSPDALYVTINDLLNEDGSHRPYEIFINTKNLQHFSWIVAMTRLISAVFRHEPHPVFLVDELKSIYDPNGGYFSDGSYVPSLAADIGRIVEKHLSKIGIVPLKQSMIATPTSETEPAPAKDENPSLASNKTICPMCKERSYVYQENCMKCLSCGYSKCG